MITPEQDEQAAILPTNGSVGQSSRDKLTRIVTLVEIMWKDVGDIKSRLSAVERWMFIQIGAATVMGGAAGYASTYIASGGP